MFGLVWRVAAASNADASFGAVDIRVVAAYHWGHKSVDDADCGGVVHVMSVSVCSMGKE
jgi:hypothetical protein